MNIITNKLLNRKNSLYIFLGAAALFFGALLFFIIQYNPGVSFDSISYLSAAQNFKEHGSLYVTAYGKKVPLVHFPPLYPCFIGGISFILNCTIQTASAVSGALLLSINIFLTGLILKKAKVSPEALFFAVVMTGISDFFFIIHAQVFTEPLYISFMLGALLSLSEYFEHKKIRFIIISGLLISCAVLTRYAGLSILITGLTALLFMEESEPLSSRIKKSALYFLLGFLPFLIWGIRNYSLAGSMTNRTIKCHIIGAGHLKQLIRTVLFIFLPDSILNHLKIYIYNNKITITLIITVFSLFLIYFIWINLKKQSVEQIISSVRKLPYIVKTAFLYSLIYFIFLILSISFADYTTPLSYRIMLPVFVLIFPISLAGIYDYCNKNSGIKAAAAKIILWLFFISYLFRFFSSAENISTDGLDFSSKKWKRSYITSFIRKLPESVHIYTNGGAGIYYQTGIITEPIPKKFKNGTFNSNYDKKLKKMAEQLKRREAVIIFYKQIPSSLLPKPDELKNKLNLTVIHDDDFGTILSASAAVPRKSSP